MSPVGQVRSRHTPRATVVPLYTSSCRKMWIYLREMAKNKKLVDWKSAGGVLKATMRSGVSEIGHMSFFHIPQ